MDAGVFFIVLGCCLCVKFEGCVNNSRLACVKALTLCRFPMKQWAFLFLAAVSGTGVWAQELGRVIASTPVVQQVAVPRQVCTTEQVGLQQPNSGAGALIGAIAGGVLGNAAGQGAGRSAATAIGAIGGAVLGDRLEGNPAVRIENVQRCGVQNFYENQTVAFNVVYEYAGKQYSVQTPTDPGSTIALHIAPIGSVPPPHVTTTVVQPTVTYITVPVQRRFYYQPYSPHVMFPFGPSVRFGHGGGHRHWQ